MTSIESETRAEINTSPLIHQREKILIEYFFGEYIEYKKNSGIIKKLLGAITAI